MIFFRYLVKRDKRRRMGECLWRIIRRSRWSDLLHGGTPSHCVKVIWRVPLRCEREKDLKALIKKLQVRSNKCSIKVSLFAWKIQFGMKQDNVGEKIWVHSAQEKNFRRTSEAGEKRQIFQFEWCNLYKIPEVQINFKIFM